MINETLGLYLPDCVLDFTEGKVAAIVGANGSKESERKKLQTIFCFSELVWYTSEERQTGPFEKAKKAILQGRYGVLFLIMDFCGHHVVHMTKPAAKAVNIPVIAIPNGYSPNGFSKAIEDQVCGKLDQKSQHARSSGQIVASVHGGRPVNY